MESFPYWRVDVFSGDGLLGNPAAVIECKRWLHDEQMLAIAREAGATVTAFLVPDGTGAADWQVRWFGAQQELRLCGHATLASAQILLGRNGAEQVSFRSRYADGLEARRIDAGVEMSIPAITTEAGEWPEAVKFIGKEPLETYRSELGYAAFFYESEEELRGLEPDLEGLASLGDDQFICTAPGRRSDIVSRVFTPGAGLGEDIATGSAHAVLTPHWAKKLGRDEISAVQASKRGGKMQCRLDDGGERVSLTGECTTLIEGRFYLSG